MIRSALAACLAALLALAAMLAAPLATAQELDDALLELCQLPGVDEVNELLEAVESTETLGVLAPLAPLTEDADNGGLVLGVGVDIDMVRDALECDTVTAPPTTTTPPAGPLYPDCAAARAAGAAPVILGDPGYRAELDADGDGIGCEDGEDDRVVVFPPGDDEDDDENDVGTVPRGAAATGGTSAP